DSSYYDSTMYECTNCGMGCWKCAGNEEKTVTVVVFKRKDD
ncbi:18625_t:CDS:1, partial [Acaulospora morrowiae]